MCVCERERERVYNGRIKKTKSFQRNKLKEVEFGQVVSFFPLWLTFGAANIFLFNWKASRKQL